MEVSYAPRGQVAAWLRAGWRLVEDHDYNEDDWAVVLCRPASPAELSEAEIDDIARRFRKPFVPIVIRSNLNKAAVWRNTQREKRARSRYDSRRLVQESA